MRSEIKQTLIFKEMCPENSKKWFDCSEKKTLALLDNIYYSVFLESDFKEKTTDSIQNMIDSLKQLKADLHSTHEEIEVGDGVYMLPYGAQTYSLGIGVKDMFDIFFCPYLRNDDTNRIIVQIRSLGLWLHGHREMLNRSLKCLESFLGYFKVDSKIKISKVQENRVDFAHHTNLIQSPEKIFLNTYLNKHCKSSAKVKTDICIKERGQWIQCYVAFGVRGKAVFTRIYDKTREVVEQGYKGAAFKLWFDNGLISRYDKYVLEQCYDEKSYTKKVLYMINFYLVFGKDEEVKKELIHLRSTYENDLSTLEKKVLKLRVLPRVTKIMNVEFETRRDYFRSCEKSMMEFKHTPEIGTLGRMYKIIDNLGIFQEHLTHYTLRFVNVDGSYMDYWRRLRNSKFKSLTKFTNLKELRNYDYKINEMLLESRVVKSISSLSVVKGFKEETTSIEEDTFNVITNLNDNHKRKLEEKYLKSKQKKAKELDKLYT